MDTERTRDDQHEYWDRVADEKTFSHPLDAGRLARHLRPDARVLDLGCGYGRATNELAQLGYDALGVDPAAGMIARGKRLFPELDLRVWSGASLPFEPACFDAALLITVLTATPGDDDQRALIAELRRVLAPGGLLLVSDLFLQDDPKNRARYAAGLERHGRMGVFELEEGVLLRHHERTWMAELLGGFEELETTEIEVTTMNGNTCRAFQYWGRRP